MQQLWKVEHALGATTYQGPWTIIASVVHTRADIGLDIRPMGLTWEAGPLLYLQQRASKTCVSARQRVS